MLLQNLWNKGLSYNGLTEFNFHSDLSPYNQIVGGAIDNDSPDISDFIARDGKLIVFQGWSDEFNAQDYPLTYFDRGSQNLSLSYSQLNENFRVFYQPGVTQCGPSTFDPVQAVVD